VAEYGDDSPITGPKSIVNLACMEQFKFNRFTEDQPEDPIVSVSLVLARCSLILFQLQYHIGRFLLSYGEASFTLNFFANGKWLLRHL
jgi:hypothetical protein